MSIQPKLGASMMWLEQQRQREYQQHRERVANQKPRIDNAPPYTCQFLNQGAKRALMEEERCNRIDSENRRLVANMSVIMERGGEIDNKEPWRGKNAERDAERRRARERERIAAENLRMLKRLQGTNSVYSVEKWESDREKNEGYASQLSRYPYHPMDRHKRVE